VGGAALALLLAAGGAAAWARGPDAGQMAAVQRLARQLSLDSGALTYTADTELKRNAGLTDEAVQRFVNFHRAAENFERQVNDPYQNPDHTEADFIALRNAYRRARMYYEAVPAPPALREAIWRTDETLSGLIGTYSDMRSPASFDPAVIRQTAAQILEIADRLQARAENQQQDGRVGVEAVKRIGWVNDAAYQFQEQVINENADPKRIGVAYDRLVQSQLDARAVMANFTMDFQDEYGALWNLTQSINTISPGAAVGGPPYNTTRPLSAAEQE
jgi:cytochrome c556